MKPPKSEPYQRSRHRAALHAWVVAATAVASIGMPAKAALMGGKEDTTGVHQHELSPQQAAQQVAAQWLEALRQGDRDAALSTMLLPRLAENERDALEEMAALSDWLVHSGAEIEPVAHQQSGHWALSAWRLDAPDDPADAPGLIEPVTLYNPGGVDLIAAAAQWEVVPQGFQSDPALAPLYNADHDELMAWYQTLQ